jgi:8-oxo-dGTP diphosphatase
MPSPQQEALAVYGQKIRVRVCGILIENDKVLMVKHKALFDDGFFWCPPGGGIDFGEKIEACLHREFAEETGLQIKIGKLLFVNEYIKTPLHSIEFFYEVKAETKNAKLGHDPELDQQIMLALEWLSIEEISTKTQSEIHAKFWQLKRFEDLATTKTIH